MTEHSVARIECVGGPWDGDVVTANGSHFNVPMLRCPLVVTADTAPTSAPVVLPCHRYSLRTWRTAKDGGFEVQRVYSYEGVYDA